MNRTACVDRGTTYQGSGRLPLPGGSGQVCARCRAFVLFAEASKPALAATTNKLDEWRKSV